MRRALTAFGPGALAAVLGIAAAPATAADCAPVSFDGARFTACRIDVAREDLRVFHTGPDGAPLGSFRAVDAMLAAEGARLGAASNGGMYHRDRSPVGLLIEGGTRRAPVVTADGPGNFGLLPNGVLCLGEGSAAVIESRAYAAAPPACRDATQSGPMLVIDGALHPRFLPRGTSTNVRNGVGVADGGRTVWLAISDEPVNFHHFARLFRDGLGTPDALYLDGRVSRLHAPGLGRHDPGLPMGPILGTVEPAR